MLLHEYLIESSLKFPNKVAVIQGNRRITYSEVREKADALSGFLVETGLAVGDRVVVMGSNSPEYIISYFGIMKSGGVVVPVGDQVNHRGLREIFLDCMPSVVVTPMKFMSKINDLIADVATLDTVIAIDDDHIKNDANNTEQCPVYPGKTYFSFCEIINSREKKNRLANLKKESIAMIIYTSGTTGAAKGVMLSHFNLTQNASSIIEYLRITERDCVMVVLPFYYSYGNSLLTTHIMTGGSLVLENNFHFPNIVLEKMIKENATGFPGVPSTFAILLNRSNIRKYIFPSLRYVTQAGGAMAPKLAMDLHRILPGTDIYIMYGQTEATARLTYLDPCDIEKKSGSIGKAIPGVKITLIKEDGCLASTGEIGEIVAEGDNIMMGYWGKPEETACVLRDYGLHTGDLARMDEEGYLYIVGRRSDMIKSGAHRISPKEIEEIIMEIPEVYESAVVGVEDELLGEVMKAYVVLKDKCTLDTKYILQYCKRNLPLYKMPKTISFVDSLPKTYSGKIKRHELKSH